MTHPMFVEKTYRPKFARQNFIKAEKFARQNSYFQALGGVTPPPPQKLRPCTSQKVCRKLPSTICRGLLSRFKQTSENRTEKRFNLSCHKTRVNIRT